MYLQITFTEKYGFYIKKISNTITRCSFYALSGYWSAIELIVLKSPY